MKNIIFILGLAVLWAACATVPYTNRKQLSLFSSGQEIQLGTEAYDDILKKTPKSKNQDWQKRLNTVGHNIAKVASRDDFQWEFNVLEGQDVNAFALPGGKVAFWDGIMPICGDDNGIAVVMGHEVAHAIARHGAERMSQGLGANILGQVLAVGLGGSDPATRDQVLQLYGVGANVGVMLPFGRKHESEADHIGLILMAKAGYDPRAAADFWRRMSAKGGQKPPEFLSTHPSDETRIRQIEEWLPEALQYYKS